MAEVNVNIAVRSDDMCWVCDDNDGPAEAPVPLCSLHFATVAFAFEKDGLHPEIRHETNTD